MASITQLSSDWQLLATEAKRRNSAVRSAVEKAQNLAKNAASSDPLTPTSPNQQLYTSPFFLALESGNDRLISASLVPIARLVALKALTQTQMTKVLHILNAFDLATHNMDTQLKILQVLPSAMQNYGSGRSSFIQIVGICANLANSPVVAVGNAALATLQQILPAPFELLKTHTSDPDLSNHTPIFLLQDEKAQPLALDELEYTCYRTFQDLCAIVAGDDLDIFDGMGISVSAALENIESIVSIHLEVFYQRAELASLLRLQTVPALLKTLNSSPPAAYPLVLRVLRIVRLLAMRQLPNLEIEMEVILLYANHIILNSSPHGTSTHLGPTLQNLVYPHWEKVLAMELFRLLCSSFECVQSLFETYDNMPQKKNVLKEILTVLKTYLLNNFSSMISKAGLVIPRPDSSIPVMTKVNSLMKISLLDHLEKIDAPSSIPEYYLAGMLLSILLDIANGVANFVESMSLNVDSETIEGEVEFITLFNETVFSDLFQLFDMFLHFSAETPFFVDTVASLQRYTHAVGLLGLSDCRDQLLVLLARCVIVNTAPEAKSEQLNSSNILSLGESIVETINQKILTPPSTSTASFDSKSTKRSSFESSLGLKSRQFNTRLIICLGALLNVTNSLGTTLDALWKILYITLQWVDYFLNGPDDYSGYNNQNEVVKIGHPNLSSQDLTELKTMKLNELSNILRYQESTVLRILNVIKDLFTEDKGIEAGAAGLEPCPFNRSFYVKQMMRFTELEYTEFLFSKSDARHFVSSLFIETATDRSLSTQFRVLIARNYATFVLQVTFRGFKTNVDDLYLAENFLKDLMSFLNSLAALGKPTDHLMLNCEAEIRLIVLSTLHDHINEYDNYYQQYWGLVFQILNTVFVHSSDSSSGEDQKLEEKIRQLILTAFNTLKLILDEFLTSLPLQYFKPLIDTLLNFCQQNYDINISFSSVSYFWLISDCINNKMSTVDSDSSPPTFQDVHALELLLAADITENSYYNEMLNTYLLARLAILATDYRSQVREGAIQTLFQILDVQGKKLNSWESIFNIVFPRLLEWDDLKPETSALKQKDFMVSLNLVLSNLVLIYSKFMMNFEKELPITERYWTRLLTFLSSMLRLRWCELSLKVFQTYLDLLIAFNSSKTVPSHVRASLFDFWINAPIEYDFVNSSYQDSLVAYLDGLKQIIPLFQQESGAFPVSKVLSNINKCARYPILKPNQKDNVKPTELQRSAIDGLKMASDLIKSTEMESSVIQQLAHICAYPFETRSRIEAKLSSKFGGRIQIPTFLAISQMAFELFEAKFSTFSNMKALLTESRLQKILKSVLFLLHNRAQGTVKEGAEPLWVRCNHVILELLHRSIAECLLELQAQRTVWELIVECITVNFEDRLEEEEQYSVQQYKNLSEKVIPALLGCPYSDQVVYLMETLYKQSFLYDFTEMEAELFRTENAFQSLCRFDFDSSFGTTQPISIKNNRAIRLMCLRELFKFASSQTGASEAAAEKLLPRVAFAVRRFIADNRLLCSKPLARIQQVEIQIVLDGLVEIQGSLKDTDRKLLSRLITVCIPFGHRVDGVDGSLETLVLLALTI